MFDMTNVSSRLLLKQLTDPRSGDPADAAVISIQRLHEFMRPVFYRKKNVEGVEIRLEWLGYQATASGNDVFAVEDRLMDDVLKIIKTDSRKFSIQKNI